jgi:hypothetical protein
MVDEVNEKYSHGKERKKNTNESDNAEADDTKYPAVVTKQGFHDDQIDIHSDFEAKDQSIANQSNLLNLQSLNSKKFKVELSRVSHTVKPIKYHS